MLHGPRTEIELEWPLLLRVSKVFADPLRVKILSECQMRPVSPQGFFEEFGEVSLDRISRAFDVLVQYDWIGRVGADSGQGSSDTAEYLYRAVDIAIVDDATMEEASGPMRRLVSMTVFESLADRVKEAVDAGTFEVRADSTSHGRRRARPAGMEQGHREGRCSFLLSSKEQEDANARMAESGEEPIPMTVALLGFESPKAHQVTAT